MDYEHLKACFYAQAIFGALALAAIAFAAISWGDRGALGAAMASCLGVILCQHFAIAGQNRIAIAAWWSAIALAILAFIMLL